MTKYKTAESVRRGHPDKLCDLIADSILDECLRHDRYSRCACEVMATKGKIFVCGEITCAAKINIRSVVREVLRKVGYNPMKFIVFVYVHRQSPDIAGGVAKEGGIAPLAKYFPKIRHAYLIGEAADDFARTLEGKVPYTISGTLENAFSAATSDAKKSASTGSVVLAPACASFDQFANFEVRGDAFMKLFEELKRGGVNGAAAAR